MKVPAVKVSPEGTVEVYPLEVGKPVICNTLEEYERLTEYLRTKEEKRMTEVVVKSEDMVMAKQLLMRLLGEPSDIVLVANAMADARAEGAKKAYRVVLILSVFVVGLLNLLGYIVYSQYGG